MATAPREIPVNGLYLVTRRVSQRELLLRPDAIVSELLLYFLGYYAGIHRIAIHSFIFLSNHFHLVVSDPGARLPEFMRDFGSIAARAINAHHGRFEYVWAPGSYGVMRLDRTMADILTALRYVGCNAVEAGLVSEAKQWPGLKVLPHEIGRQVFRAHRPDWFCNASRGNRVTRHGSRIGRQTRSRRVGRSRLPEETSFTTCFPEAIDGTEPEMRDALIRACKEREAEIRERNFRSGRAFMGVKKILAQNPRTKPHTSEARWEQNPRILAAVPSRRVARIQQLKEFLARYATALERFLARQRDALFPYGTYKMRVYFNACCEPAPAFC